MPPRREPAIYPRILLTGAPGGGKTTVLRTVIALLGAEGVKPGGFITEEMREGGRRTGFITQEIGGASAVIARAGGPGGTRVGRYGVDVAAFECIALPAMERAGRDAQVVIIDEIGQMELASEAFTARLDQLFAIGRPLVATVHLASHPVTDSLIHRPGVELVHVNEHSRIGLPEQLAARLLAALGKASA